ncbi:MAG: hypothetical protein DRP74_03325 [Candidatus Omnitrophota bacterium]|nr:MAG: hypothetical protein DRP74_03325 [Candidatus Omnitrophota bacterium]
MPAIATLEDLKKLEAEIDEIKKEHHEVCEKIMAIIKRNRKIGYRNFCKLFMGERTPEELKSGEKRKK